MDGDNNNKYNYLVSICIPTYNRATCLKNTVRSIITQQPFIDRRVEIAVTDNASTDSTEELCKSYVTRYNNFHYYRNTVNIHDRNFPTCLSNSSGYLRKLCNDTMLFKPGALDRIVFFAERYKASRPILFFENGLYKRVKPWKRESSRVGVISQKDTFTKELSFNDFMLRETYWLTSLANLSFWAEDCQKGSGKDEKLYKYHLWQLAYSAEILASGRKAVCIKEELFTIQETKRNVYVEEGLLYKIFYQNMFSIIAPYFENKQLSMHCRDVLEKDLLLSYFLQKVAEYEVDSSIPKDKVNKLKRLIDSSYRDKEYYYFFMFLYKLKVMKNRLEKHRVKKCVGRDE